jgi:transposase InsO family protein
MVLDVYSRKIVGWSFGEEMKATLVTQALDMAIYLRRPKAGLIHHVTMVANTLVSALVKDVRI